MADIEVGGRFGRLYRVLDWPVRLVGLNVLWFMGVLAGLVVAGLAPATFALYALLREYLLGTSPRPWRDFWTHWRSALTASQLALGVPILTMWVVVFYTLAARGTPFALGAVVFTFGYGVTLLQLPAVLAHLELSVTEAWRATVTIVWRRPLLSVGIGLLTVALVLGVWFSSPAALPLFFPAVPALLGAVVVHRALPRPTS
ncbi:YesL family protein [Phytoactinopolyspora endophytica]|uniref:YesL family protein n=1 Tax=Phytoactinopolyspora endophytica TaxID=1642495 RepID=UPI0013EABFBD|nr:DUF624 domain-containing protein [Phytoactinopolyspora endophytica]